MPACAVCTHDQRKAIDSALVSGKAVRRVATQHALTEASVRRHKHKHLASKRARVEAGRQASYLERIEAYLSEAQADLRACRESGEMRTLGSLHRPVFAALELIGVVGGEVPTGSQVTVNFFQKLGVRDESEALGLISQARLLRDANADGDEDSALEVLEGVLRDDPARREPLQRKLMRMIGDVARVDSQPASLGSSPPSRRPRPAPLNGDAH